MHFEVNPARYLSPKEPTFSIKDMSFKKKKRTKKEMKVVGGHAMPIRDFSR